MGWGKIFTSAIKKEVQSTFAAYKEEIEEASVNKAVERLGSQVGASLSFYLTHPVSALKSVGILSPYTASDVATQAYMSNINFSWDQWWWSKNNTDSGQNGNLDLPWGMALNRWGHYNEKEWGELWYKNRAGATAGRMVGDTAGNIIGLFFPALGAIAKEIFGELGSIIGVGIYGTMNGSLPWVPWSQEYPNRPVGGTLVGGTTLSEGTPHNPASLSPPAPDLSSEVAATNARGLNIVNQQRLMAMMGW
jgi:hypothetical protein